MCSCFLFFFSWLYNLFDHYIDGKIKGMLQDKVKCVFHPYIIIDMSESSFSSVLSILLIHTATLLLKARNMSIKQALDLV